MGLVQMSLDQIIKTSTEQNRKQQEDIPGDMPMNYKKVETKNFKEMQDLDMKTAWGATIKLAEEVTEIKKSMERMQNNIKEKEKDIFQLSASIENERRKVILN